jgi:threonine dehydratase
LPFSILARFVSTSVLVEDGDIARAQAILIRELRSIVEPGGATALAALVGGAYRRAAGERVAVVVSGGNADPATIG